MDPLDLFLQDLDDPKGFDLFGRTRRSVRPTLPRIPDLRPASRDAASTRQDGPRARPAPIPTLSRDAVPRSLRRQVTSAQRERERGEGLTRTLDNVVDAASVVASPVGLDTPIDIGAALGRFVRGDKVGGGLTAAGAALPFVGAGVTRALAKNVPADKIGAALAENGGFTFDPRTGEFISGRGYVVANPPGNKASVIENPTADDIRRVVEENEELLGKPGMMFGGWRDSGTGKTYLEVSEVLDDLDEAMRRAVERDEKAIFDLSKFEDIPNPQHGLKLPFAAMEPLREYSTRARPDLLESIKTEGIRDPIRVVYDPSSGRTVVEDGSHRMDAAYRLGLDEVPVRVRTEGLSDMVGQPAPEALIAALRERGVLPQGEAVIRSLEPEPVAATPAGPRDRIPEQQPLDHYVGTRTPQSALDEARERMARAFRPGGKYGRIVAKGEKVPGAPEWYDTREMFDEAEAIAGPEGADQINEILNMMAASTARSEPKSNLRRAIMWSALKRRGLLPRDLGSKTLFPVPPGFGHFAQRTTHQPAVGHIVREGGLHPHINPKPTSFGGAGPFGTGNLGLNWEPATIDDVMSRAAVELDPALQKFFDIKVNPETGAISAAPKGTFYGALDAGFRDAAKKAAKQGRVPVPDSRFSPTAPYQAMGWTGLTGSGELGSLTNIWRMLRDEDAAAKAITPEESVRRLLMEQQPFGLFTFE